MAVHYWVGRVIVAVRSCDGGPLNLGATKDEERTQQEGREADGLVPSKQMLLLHSLDLTHETSTGGINPTQAAPHISAARPPTQARPYISLFDWTPDRVLARPMGAFPSTHRRKP